MVFIGQMVLYLLVTLFATAFGAATGMGGGLIIKPVLDMIGHYGAASITFLSAAAVFVTAAVSLWRQRKNTDKPEARFAVPLALGSMVGGSIGSMIFEHFIASAAMERDVIVTQNIILAVLIALVFTYMLIKEKLPSLKLSGILPAALIGLIVGVISSFLGIGGGPLNVALIVFLFAYPTKVAILCSLLAILFGQASKLLYTAVFAGFDGLSLNMLPAMLVGAVLGGFIGATVNKRVSARATDRLFNAFLITVFCMCIVNIVRYGV